MSIAEKLVKVSENVPKVYTAGQKSVAVLETVTGDPAVLNYVHPTEHELDVRVTSKNLFNKDDTTCLLNGYVSGDGAYMASSGGEKSFIFKCQPNTDYVVSKVQSPTNRVAGFSTIPSSGTTGIKLGEFNDTDTYTFNSGTAEYIIVWYLNNHGETVTNAEMLNSIQLEVGTTATPYTPYIADLSDVLISQDGLDTFMSGTDGKVFGVRSKSPTTTLQSIAPPGVLITATYYLDTADGGCDHTLIDPLEIALDFSAGDMVMELADNYVVNKATIFKPDTLIPENIAKDVEIAGIVGTHEGGGGGSADVRYVTFTNASTGETFVKPVAVGDDCVDVVAKGLWAKPTQESTAQYDYAFANGWSATPGGAADANILKNITEDKTVYAAFTATVRYYTITWLDSDGVTELPGQKQWAYGSVPSYTPTKEGQVLTGWLPMVSPVVGDVSYVAQWSEGYSFANSSWEDIARIAESGEAEKHFRLGDERVQNMGSTLGTQTLVIIGFNHDDLSDGTGKAGITIAMKYISTAQVQGSQIYAKRNTIQTQLPSDLSAVIKKTDKSRYNTSKIEINPNQVLWYFSNGELYDTSANSTYSGTTPYAGISYLSQETNWWLRDAYSSGGMGYVDFWSGDRFHYSTSGYSSNNRYMRFGFCI